jgi:penicillin-binding protein 1C
MDIQLLIVRIFKNKCNYLTRYRQQEFKLKKVNGKMGGTMNSICRKRARTIRKVWQQTMRIRGFKITAFILTVLLIWYVLIPLPRTLFQQSYSTVVIDEQGNLLRAFLNDEQQWCFPPDPRLKIPEKLITCILNFEDTYFYQHPGINPISLVRSIFQNLSSNRIRSGASTISMQVIRLALKKTRTIPNKILEMFQALKLELRYSKKRILHFYVNHAPYGGNIIGYQAASLKYFRKKPEQLTWSESAILAVLPNSPGLISPLFNRDTLLKKRDFLLKKLLKKKKIDQETCSISLQEPLARTFSNFFINAPHLSQTLKDQLNVKSGQIHTTINRKHQVRIEDLVKQHLLVLQSQGIYNGAALVVETQSRKIRAYVGSQDFFDRQHGGQNDGLISPRSTGSILKPFLYALAMDEGIILPQTRIKDVPSYFGSFSPSNASKKYSGLISAKDALIHSLNVPASRLLNTYGLHKFHLFLESAGLSTLFRKPDEYGLTLILGGAEATLFDLAMLYCGLGNRGSFRPLILIHSDHGESSETGTDMISPEACYLTLDMLKDVKRPGSEFYWEQYQSRHPIAWKTGTSYGQRDAWSVGVTPQWTIAVWVGNFSGEGNPNLSGAGCAAPLMFDIFNYLPKSRQLNWFDKAKLNLKKVKLCLGTGFVAGPHCPETYWAEAPKINHPLKSCPYHRTLFTSPDEKHQVCSLCWKPDQYKKIKHLIYPPDVAQYLREKGMIISDTPPHKKDCPGYSESRALQITYPVQNAKMWIPRDFDGTLQKITFKVAHRIKNRTVYWYLDNVYQGYTRRKHKWASELKKGWHRLDVIDSEGNRDHRMFFISIRTDSR